MKKALVAITVLLALLLPALFVAVAQAEEVWSVAIKDELTRTESPLSYEGRWQPLNWSGGTVKPGRDTTAGWGPSDAFPTINGAYWSYLASDTAGGDAVGLTVNASPEVAERYVSVWLDMPNPGAEKSGYQLRWTLNSGLTTYAVKLSKWVAGTETVLDSNSSVSIPSGTRMMLSDNGGTVTAWQGTTTGTAVLSAADSTYSSGYGGIEASGNISRSKEWRLASYDKSKLTNLPMRDDLQRSEQPLSNGGKWTKPASATSIGSAWNTSTSPFWLGYGTGGSYLTSAYWNPETYADSGEGVGVSSNLTVGPSSAQWEAVYLDGGNLGTASLENKYEVRWTGTATAGSYTLDLAKVASGTRTVLASRTATIEKGDTIALTEKQGNLVAWVGNLPVPVLIASDSSFNSGYAGMSVYGGMPTADNFRAGPLVLAPGKPTVSATVPASPANNNAPTVKGTADTGSTVQLFTNSSCTGSPAASGSAATFASPGIAASVADNTTTTFYANATNSYGTSPCSTTSVTYVEDSAAPAAPTVSSTSPASPANNNAPKVLGSAESGSTVKLYTNSTCTSALAATGTAAAFVSPGIGASVADNTTTTFYATATDAAGNVSPCSSTSVTYVEDSSPPAVPTVSSTNPASGSNNNEPKVIGSAEAGSTVKLYTNGTCTSSVAASGSASSFASPGITASVGDNTTTTFYATATDAAGNASACSTTSVKYEEATPKIYWGAWLGGNAYTTSEKKYGDGPWDQNTWNLFEEHAGKKISLEHFGQPAPWNQAFAEEPLRLTRERGALPVMDMDADGFSQKEIVEGKKDSYFKTWATAVKNYGYPLFFRWEWEMNGTWFPYGSEVASNPTLYKEVWWHLHKLFEEQGASNITWVWCPNLSFPGSTSLSSLYPGNEYVDWTCLDGYNFGKNPEQPDSWKSFSTLYKTSYEELLSLAPTKPIMIGEMASTEYGGEKSAWITDAIGTQIPTNFPKIKAMLWYNKWDGAKDWPIETSTSAQTAFKNAIASPIYATNNFGSPTKLTKIEPLP
ncbi:MAG TPA: glycosyl hydrolase [Solirubrobacterales bacterium]|nr:glycosyl hydrolase [Solirubrobacterales bacterium]